MKHLSAIYFVSAADFRRWLQSNHATASELLVGFYKKTSGRGGLTYPEAVDELLCFGWIDGVKRRVDDQRYTHRVTPRRPRSTWSLVNVRHVQRLAKAGRMHSAGMNAYRARQPERTGVYSYERSVPTARSPNFPSVLAAQFRANKKAWGFWQTQPPGYQRVVIHWVTRAKQAATRGRRLRQVIAASAGGRRVGGR